MSALSIDRNSVEGTGSPRADVVVVIPTLNEQESIEQVIRGIPSGGVNRVIVVDSGSNDATTTLARRAGADVIDVGPGYGRACLKATEAAADADILVFMDGDGADDTASIAALVAPIRSGDYDFVIGSRVRGAREPGSMAWHQIGAGLLAGLGMRLLYGVRYTDMCAFRAIRRDTLLRLGMRELTYGWNIEMQMRAARSGYGSSKSRCPITAGSAARRKSPAAFAARSAPAPASWRRSPGFRRSRSGNVQPH